MARQFIAALLLVLQALASASASANAAPATVKVALFDVAPYAHLAKGQPTGLYVELARRLLGSAGLSSEIKILPFARLPVALQQGEADLTIAFGTDELDRVAKPLLPVALVDSIVVAKTPRKLGSLYALKGLTVGRARRGCHDLAAHDELAIRWVDVSGFDSALRMLALDWLDAVCLTREVLRYQLLVTGLDSASFSTGLVVGQRKVWIFVRPGLDADVLARLRSSLGQRPLLRFD
jgi:ABC-type amino acid transport substrate-binding protein